MRGRRRCEGGDEGLKPIWSIVPLAIAFSGIGVAADFQLLTSPTIKHKGTIGKAHVFNGFGCSGDNDLNCAGPSTEGYQKLRGDGV